MAFLLTQLSPDDYNRSLHFSCAQDLVYFGLWSVNVFPTGEWTYMGMCHALGTWTTSMQIGFSIAATLTLIISLHLLKRQTTQLLQLQHGRANLKPTASNIKQPQTQQPTKPTTQTRPQYTLINTSSITQTK